MDSTVYIIYTYIQSQTESYSVTVQLYTGYIHYDIHMDCQQGLSTFTAVTKFHEFLEFTPLKTLTDLNLAIDQSHFNTSDLTSLNHSDFKDTLVISSQKVVKI